jgi:hypothetical protein
MTDEPKIRGTQGVANQVSRPMLSWLNRYEPSPGTALSLEIRSGPVICVATMCPVWEGDHCPGADLRVQPGRRERKQGLWWPEHEKHKRAFLICTEYRQAIRASQPTLRRRLGPNRPLLAGKLHPHVAK